MSVFQQEEVCACQSCILLSTLNGTWCRRGLSWASPVPTPTPKRACRTWVIISLHDVELRVLKFPSRIFIKNSPFMEQEAVPWAFRIFPQLWQRVGQVTAILGGPRPSVASFPVAGKSTLSATGSLTTPSVPFGPPAAIPSVILSYPVMIK